MRLCRCCSQLPADPHLRNGGTEKNSETVFLPPSQEASCGAGPWGHPTSPQPPLTQPLFLPCLPFCSSPTPTKTPKQQQKPRRDPFQKLNPLLLKQQVTMTRVSQTASPTLSPCPVPSPPPLCPTSSPLCPTSRSPLPLCSHLLSFSSFSAWPPPLLSSSPFILPPPPFSPPPSPRNRTQIKLFPINV